MNRKKQVPSSDIESPSHGGRQRFDSRSVGLRLRQLSYDFVVYKEGDRLPRELCAEEPSKKTLCPFRVGEIGCRERPRPSLFVPGEQMFAWSQC